MFDDLTEDNFMIFAAKHYINPHCRGIDDFNDDLNHFKYLKRLFNRYQKDGVLKTNLIVSHIIVLYNVFEAQAMTRMLFFKIDQDQWSLLKPFLVMLNHLPNQIIEGSKIINTVDIPLNKEIVEELRVI
tara:strand:+ start:1114 stop:1500 length:387 start_codon:yes stop_codon:yes gene_type:complete